MFLNLLVFLYDVRRETSNKKKHRFRYTFEIPGRRNWMSEQQRVRTIATQKGGNIVHVHLNTFQWLIKLKQQEQQNGTNCR